MCVCVCVTMIMMMLVAVWQAKPKAHAHRHHHLPERAKWVEALELACKGAQFVAPVAGPSECGKIARLLSAAASRDFVIKQLRKMFT